MSQTIEEEIEYHKQKIEELKKKEFAPIAGLQNITQTDCALIAIEETKNTVLQRKRKNGNEPQTTEKNNTKKLTGSRGFIRRFLEIKISKFLSIQKRV